MGWKHIGKGSYMYLSQRADGRVRSEYIGGGAVGQAMAECLALQKTRQILQREREAGVRAGLQEAEQIMQNLASAVEQVFRARMVAAGYHEHRHEWRKRRHPPGHMFSSAEKPASVRTLEKQQEPANDIAAGLKALGQLLAPSDESFLQALQRSQRFLDGQPDLVALNEEIRQAQQYLPVFFLGNGQELWAVLQGIAAVLRRSLDPVSEDPLERLLVDLVVVVSLQQVLCNAVLTGTLAVGKASQAKFVRTAVGKAERRLKKTVKQLVTVRKLLR